MAILSFPYEGTRSSLLPAAIAFVASAAFEAVLNLWWNVRAYGTGGPYLAVAVAFAASGVFWLGWLIRSLILSRRTIELGDGGYAEVGLFGMRRLDLRQLGPRHVRFEGGSLVVHAYKLPGAAKGTFVVPWDARYFVAFAEELRAVGEALPYRRLDQLFVQLDEVVARQETIETMRLVASAFGASHGYAGSVRRIVGELQGRAKESDVLREKIARLRDELEKTGALPRPNAAKPTTRRRRERTGSGRVAL